MEVAGILAAFAGAGPLPLERPRYVGPRGENRRRRRRRCERQRRARAIRQMQRDSRKANRRHG